MKCAVCEKEKKFISSTDKNVCLKCAGIKNNTLSIKDVLFAMVKKKIAFDKTQK